MSLLWFPVDTRQALSEQGQEQLMMQASASEFLGNITQCGAWVQPPTVPPQPGILAAPLWSIVPGCPRACL